MAVRHIYIDAGRDDVWAALADGARYADWVVGTKEIRHEDPGWPAVGSEIRFVAGIGPVSYSDRTVVRVNERPDRLELEIGAGYLGKVRVAFQLIPWGEGTVVVVDEHPLYGAVAGLHGPHAELLLNLRNRLMLRNLRSVVMDKAGERRAEIPVP
ncbi:SRPBCC family protein [Actinomadura parmotrematis]|uniref:SRPBCC family protein n=1 Tax=Actinomadura parmotrematis TaxID=2864039 RepID=A0ABS7FTY8_9ACTN|nr:SRPBCC family protein [Actinomadura parmotrematis]MBW8483875.1 SRPBCC family protein [Actinomadura parmotrematis]